MSLPPPTDLTAFFDLLCDAAAKQTLPRFRQPLSVTNKLKGDFDPVTEADREAEKVIREIIEIDPEGKGTDISSALAHFLSAMKIIIIFGRKNSFELSENRSLNLTSCVQQTQQLVNRVGAWCP